MKDSLVGHVRNEKQLRLFGEVDEYVKSRFGLWSQWRQHLHANPELSWQEEETTNFIRECLGQLELNLVAGPRGKGGFVNFQSRDIRSTRMLAVRGDIDAIPVTEANDVAFRSTVDGVMHACGHDVHAVVVLAVCDTLNHLLSNDMVSEPWNIRAIFQPAEEVAQGATESIACGAIDGVEAIIAMHVDPARPVGVAGFRDGVQTACCDEIHIDIEGMGGHGARPHETTDPIFAATQFINAAYAMVPRVVDAREDLVLSFCQIKGGESANVIPTHVEIKGTLRSFNPDTRETIIGRLRRLAQSISLSFGVDARFETGVSIPSVTNSPELNGLMKSAAGSFLPAESIIDVDASLGGEDFACYQQSIQGAMVRLGSAGDGFGSAHLHSPHFDVDEQVIAVACRLFVRTILQWIQTTPDRQI